MKFFRVIPVFLLLAGSIIVSQSEPAAADARYNYLQFNMCGRLCINDGNDSAFSGVVDAVFDSIQDFRPIVVSLQEVCSSQHNSLESRLKSSGFPMEGEFITTKADSAPCRGDKSFGISIFVKGTDVIREVVELRNRTSAAEKRKMICARFNVTPSVRIRGCSTHLVPRDQDSFYNQLQITDVANYLNPRASSGTAIVLGGDFNATPAQLGQIYASGSGQFREVDDPQNESTHSSGKIDYIFVNQQRFYNLTGDATTSSFSDHSPLRGTATVTS